MLGNEATVQGVCLSVCERQTERQTDGEGKDRERDKDRIITSSAKISLDEGAQGSSNSNHVFSWVCRKTSPASLSSRTHKSRATWGAWRLLTGAEAEKEHSPGPVGRLMSAL